MRTSAISLFATASILAPMVSGQSAPPEYYDDTHYVPSYGRPYGRWTIDRPMNLYERKSEQSKLIATIEKGEIITALAGVVQTTGGYYRVVVAGGPFAKGDRIYAYTNTGYEQYIIWNKGKMVQMNLPTGLFDVPPHSVWWVKIKTKKGTIGWCNFTNIGMNDDKNTEE